MHHNANPSHASPLDYSSCDATINLASPSRAGFEGRGFGRQFINTYVCPTCKAERRLIVRGRSNGRPSTGPGTFRCGAYISEDAATLAVANWLAS